MKKVILLSVLSLLVVACQPKQSSSRNTTTSRIVDANGMINGFPYSNGTSCSGQSTIGSIYDQGNVNSLYAAGSFQDRVKALLSATINPDEVGQISSAASDQTGVRFQGAIRLDASGNVMLQQSSMLIKVYDSYVLESSMNGSNQFQAIPIQFNQASEGRFNLQTGVGYVMFRDNYGWVRFDGRFDTQTFTGTVSYANSVNVMGGTPAQGQLGQFSVARCGIIQ